jgi:phosphoglycerate dehydrogenase-like enzyme
MKVPVFVADSGIHASVLECLASDASGLELLDSAVGAAALITQSTDLDASLLEAAGDRLEAIVLLEPAAAEVGEATVPVHRIDNPALTGVAEHTVLLMLALSMRLPWIFEQTGRQAWAPGTAEPSLTNQRDYAYNWVGLDSFGMLAGSTVGLVGLGTIGKATARMLAGFSANVVYTKRTRLSDAEEVELGVGWRTLDQLLEESDYVSLHHRFVDGDDGNDKEFGAEAFRRMKSTAFFINTARGRMVDEDALCDALESGQIAGAALDVFRYEPLPAHHRFFDMPSDRLILTPHLAGVPMNDGANTVVRQICAILGGV